MLEPVLVLNGNETVGQTLEQMDHYPNLSHVAMRLEVAGGARHDGSRCRHIACDGWQYWLFHN
jgi:hypothetical protein